MPPSKSGVKRNRAGEGIDAQGGLPRLATASSGASASQKKSPSELSTEKKQEIIVKESDVLWGRDDFAFNHPGNVYFRELVRKYGHAYQSTSIREQKATIVHQILQHIEEKGGRFIRREGKTWTQPPEDVTYRKVCHALRSAKPRSPTKPSLDVSTHKSISNDIEHQRMTFHYMNNLHGTALNLDSKSTGIPPQPKPNPELRTDTITYEPRGLQDHRVFVPPSPFPVPTLLPVPLPTALPVPLPPNAQSLLESSPLLPGNISHRHRPAFNHFPQDRINNIQVATTYPRSQQEQASTRTTERPILEPFLPEMDHRHLLEGLPEDDDHDISDTFD